MIDKLFGSKTRIKLLNLFLNNSGRAFYVREITRDIGEQINSVRRELANLLGVGIIKSDTVDNKLYYEVDATYKFYEPLKAMFSSEEAVASDIKVSVKVWAKKIAMLGDVKLAIFSGKLVHGSDSEIDVLIVGDNVSSIKLKNTIKALEKDNGGSLTYTLMTFNDFYYRMSVKDKFISKYLKSKNQPVIDVDELVSKDDGLTE
jgi:hypothetical protein